MTQTGTSLKNNFLIAMPSLDDPFFNQSVVYLCEHTEEGAMGLIINRASDIMLHDLLSHLEIPHNETDTNTTPIMLGGPVETNQGMLLHTQTSEKEASLLIDDNIFLSGSTDVLKQLSNNTTQHDLLIALGYASWGPGQLEQEITQNDWLTVPADHDILFNTTGQEAWQKAAELIGVDINLMASTAGHA